MGMASSDDEAQIMEDRALLDWAKEHPQAPGDWDHPASEEERARHDHDVKEWLNRRPHTRTGYENERR